MRLVPPDDGETPTGAALLTSPVRRAIVDALADGPRDPAGGDVPVGQTAAQLAELLGLHVTTLRFHLDQLEEAGLVSAEFSRAFGVGRPRKVYTVAPGSLDSDRVEAGRQILVELLAEAFGEDITPVDAGRRWAHHHVPADDSPPADSPGRWLTKVGRMIDVLQDWGYTPNLSTSDGGRACRVDLVSCPFLELARTNPAVVCGIHRGLIQGVMQQLGEPATAVSLEPFVEPELCQAHVRTRTPFRTRPSYQES